MQNASQPSLFKRSSTRSYNKVNDSGIAKPIARPNITDAFWGTTAEPAEPPMPRNASFFMQGNRGSGVQPPAFQKKKSNISKTGGGKMATGFGYDEGYPDMPLP